jgi:hypothetical protein
MADMFGTPIGTRAFEADSRAAVDFGLDSQFKMGQIAMQPLQAKKMQLEGEKLQFEMDETKAMRELMMKATAGGREGAKGPDPVEQLDNVAGHLISSGYVVKGGEIAKVAADLRQKTSQMLSAEATRRLNQIRTLREQTEYTAETFGGVKNQSELDLANRIYQFQTGRPSPYEGAEYSPALVNTINQSALTAKDRLDLEEKGLTREFRNRQENRLTKQFELEQRVREGNLEVRRQTEARRAKNAGPGAGRLPGAEPKTQEIDQVVSFLRRDYPFLSGERDKQIGNSVNEAAYTIAAEARAKMRANPALSISAALNMAYTEAQKAGDFEADAGTAIGGFGRKFKFAGGGRSPETAVPVPKTAADAKVGRYYVNSRGDVARWDGKKFVPAQAGSNRLPLSGDNRRPESEEDD